MSNFHWTDIISLNSSQNDAFEELLCQLAKKEDIQNKKKFIKVGNPDGGVECYVILDNDDEIGFQAKWFLSTPQDTQWNQVEHSLKTTLITHPKMVTYYVAIPQDRADPRIPNRISFMDKWNEKVKKWKKFAKDTYGRDIEFEYWGSSELITRLGKDENVGLKSFFFGDIDLSNDWFENQNKHAIADLDKRYTPEINVELDILENFDALSRNDRFKNKIDSSYHEFMVSYRNFLDHLYEKNEHIESLVTPLTNKINALEALYELIIFDGIAYIEFNQIEELLEEIGNISNELSDHLDEINYKEIEEKKIKTSHGYRTSTKYDSNIRDFRDYLSNLYQFKEIINSRALMLANNPFMILDGEAGIGKSHLLADIVNERIKENSNSIFLLGQQFREDKNPWNQIFDLLQLKCNKEEFLGALNAKAESQNKRLIIFVDAINEGKGRDFWNEFLISFIESIKKYEWLGLVLSIRSSYFDLIVPKNIFEKGLAIPITHLGFEGVEYNASKIFFENYNILQPSIPLLHPEFSNPLFLKLFCEGLNKKGLTHIPDGYEGITNIIKFFIEGIEEKLSKKYTNIKSLKLIRKVIDIVIPMIIDNQTIAYDDTLAIVIEKVTSKYGVKPEFLDDLIIEGMFIKNLSHNYLTGEYVEKIYFAYERFEDHLKVKYLFDNYLDKKNPKESFKKSPLNSYLEEDRLYNNQGIIDAMSIQLPEFCNIELYEILNNNITAKSFIDNLVWRKVDSITPNVVDRIVKNIDNEHFQEDIYKILFSTASNPNHPLNANLLFDYLSKFTMKDRDVFLIPLLNSIYINYETNPIKRLIDWAWSDEDKSYISDDSILLTSIALSWLLTSSNRQLRDYATKALISLLQNRVTVILELLKKFENINEPYIYERLFAVSFGVVIRLENYAYLKELGEYIYNTIFNKDEVYPHILLRDYAKNTIDYISYLGVILDINFDKTIPPYNSEFPQIDDLPKKEDIEKYQDRDKNYHQSRIISSMVTNRGYGSGGYGDFGRYVFESKLYDFECKKDAQLISNYATKKIFEEYGYNGEFFNDAEKVISSMNRGYDRHNHSTERIGKKYQWIAFFDTLARVTDNFKMYDSSSWGDEKEEMQYQGAFEPCVRDIDPTILIKQTKVDRKSNKSFWWTSKVNIDWGMDNTTWVNDTNDLPNPQNILNVIDENDEEWIVLSSFPDWDEPIKKGYDKYKVIHKGLWYQFRSYLVPKKELNNFKLWADKQWFWNDWMPSEKGHSQMFNREHYWSEAYKFFQNPYYGGHEDWTEIEPGYGTYDKKYTHKVALTTDQYYWEDEYDNSKEGSFSILKLSKILFDGLNMRYSKKDGEFIDKSNNLTCFEASVDNETHQCLLVKKENLLKFLNDNDLTIVWTIIGEKQIHTPMYKGKDFSGLMQISGYTYLNNEKIENGKIQIKNMDSNHKENFIEIDLTAKE